MKRSMVKIGLCVLVSSVGLVACKKKTKDPETTTPAPSYTVPTTYNSFTNVDHTESTIVLGMMSELSTEIAKGTGSAGATVPVSLNAQHLKDLFANQNSQFTTNAAFNTSGYAIKNYCIAGSDQKYNDYIDTLVKVSNAGVTASSGVAGLGLSVDASPKRFLLTSKGENYSQMIFKNLMADVVLNQITARVADNSLDNSANVSGKNYTAMEHNWDIAFGFYGVADSFPTNKVGVKYWGSYSNQIDAGLGCNKVMMDAFLKGRAAISNKDMSTKNEQAAIIIAEMDKMTAGAVIQEVNEMKGSLTASDQVKVISQLSEAKGFVLSMKNNKNAGRIITDAQINALLALFPSNNWNVTPTDINNIRDYVGNVYGFTAAQLLAL